MPRHPATLREILGQAWSIAADNALADVTAAVHQAARGNPLRAAFLLARAQRELAEAEIECRAESERRIIADVTKGRK